MAPAAGGCWGGTRPTEGPLQRLDVRLDHRVLRCVQSSLFLIHDGHELMAALLNMPVERGRRGGLQLANKAVTGLTHE